MNFFSVPGSFARPSLCRWPSRCRSRASATAAPASAATAQYDECESDFIAFVGSDVYQFSPALSADLGTVHLFSVLSYQKTAARGDFGRAFWRLEIRGPLAGDPGVMADAKAPLVRVAGGVARIEADGQARVDYAWNGRDEGGKAVAPGHYEYTFHARFLPDSVRSAGRQLRGAGEGAGHRRRRGAEHDARRHRRRPHRCHRRPADEGRRAGRRLPEAAQHADRDRLRLQLLLRLDPQPLELVGRRPADQQLRLGQRQRQRHLRPRRVYDYARNTAGLDYWVVNEHNHLFDDAMTTNAPPVTEAKIKARYQSGLAAAAAATVNDAFVAIYGMEWGVLTNHRRGARHAARDPDPVRLGDLLDLQRPQPGVHHGEQLLLRRLHAPSASPI